MKTRLAVAGILATISIVFLTGTARAQCLSTKTITCGSSSTDFIGSPSSCVIDGLPTRRYEFNAVAGQSVSFVASNSSAFSIGMALYDSFGRQLATSFDEPSQITYSFALSGAYFLEVNFANPQQSGSVVLQTSCITEGPPPSATCSYAGTLLIGQSVTAQLNTADATCGDSSTYSKPYKVVVKAGDAFTVNYSASYTPELWITGPDSSGSYRRSTDSSLSTAYVAPSSGNVTIWAESSGSAPKIGTFTLTLTPLTLGPCGKGRAVRH